MSGAQNWSVKGIDPKVREAAREAAARQGMSLGEYLNQALASGQLGGGGAQSQSQHTPQQPPRGPRPRAFGTQHTDYDGEDDWGVSAGVRTSDPSRLAQRIESIERRTQLAVTGLDRAVSTIDRSVLGLAARIEDAEAASNEAAERISDALEQFRAAGDTLSGQAAEVTDVKHRLEQQVAVAEEVARRAEAAASFLTNEMSSGGNILAQTLAEARTVAEEAARQATEASIDAVNELRRLQDQLSERLSESETSTRRAIESAVAEVRTETSSETRGAREALLEEVVRLESEISKRVGSVDALKAEQATLIGRIERAEAGARESTAGLRQAAGAAIADLRNAQLTLSARVKQVEDIAGASGAVDLTDVRQSQQDIAERLSALETKSDTSPLTGALAAFEARIASVEAATANTSTAKIDQIGETVESLDRALQRLNDKLEETESTANTAIRHIEETVSSLGARIEQGGGASQETEAVRAMLEQRLDTMAQSVREEITQELHAVLAGEEGVEGALTDVNKRLAAAERRQAQTIEAISIEIKRMSETVDQRLRTVEARNDDAAASAVREELTRMSSTLAKRFDEIEQRFDEVERREASAFDRMGLEVGRLSERLEERVGAVEQRSAQAIEHVGEQVARMADRFNQRQDILARELGERMLDSEERAGQRVSEAISSIMQRLAEVEEHSQEAIAPVQKAVSNVASKLEEFESGRAPATPAAEPPITMTIPTPSRRTEDASSFDRSTFPSFDATDSFDLSDPEPQPYTSSPRDSAQPVRAAPLPPRAPVAEAPNDQDIYFAEDNQIDDLLVDDNATEEAFVPPEYKSIQVSPDDDLLIDDPAMEEVESVAAPPLDDDPFWSPEDDLAPQTIEDAVAPLVAPPAQAATDVPLGNVFEDEALALDLPDLTELPPLPEEPAGPAAKNDYLANARKAAQAQSLPKTRPDTPKEAPKLSLRGSSRIVLWGAASLVAVALVGGAYYFKNRAGSAEPQTDEAPAPLPVTGTTPLTEAAPADPFAEAPAEGVAPDATAPVEGAAPAAAAPTGTPLAQNAAPTTQPVVAGPLPARNVSIEQAAQSGDLTAQYELALQRISAGRTAEGVTMLRRAADRGFAMAQYRLAKLYERGEGVPADLTIARQWTERAAGAGNRRAMHDLGVYFARGEGAPLDEAAAFRWFRQAAELGVADSQYNLGVLYQQGRGVNASASEALFWFMVAARQGDQDAGARATALEAQLAPQQVEQARARAQAFRPRASSAVANGEFGTRAWNTRPAA